MSEADRSGTTGEKNGKWKGDNAGYTSIHDWIRKWKGIPSLCEMCGTVTSKKFEWANIDHKYRRVLEDYIRMCCKCHKNYDKNILCVKWGRKRKV